MDPIPLNLVAIVVSALVAVVLALWRRQTLADRKSDARELAASEREERAAQRCAKEIGDAVERIKYLENRSYEDQNGRLDKCMEVMLENAHAFARIVELEKSRQSASGKHHTIPGA